MATYHVATTGSDANGGTSLADAKLTPQAGINLLTAGDTLEIHPGTYTITTGLTFPAAVSSTEVTTTVRGYDGAMPTIQAGANSLTLFTLNQSGVLLQSLYLDGNSPTYSGATGAEVTVAHTVGLETCKVRCSLVGVNLGALSRVVACEILSGLSFGGVYCAAGGIVQGCYIHDCSTGITFSANSQTYLAVENVIEDCSVGIAFWIGQVIRGNTIVGMSSHGMRGSFDNNYGTALVQDNLIASCGGYGISTAATNIRQHATINHNAFYLNTSGNYQGLLAGEHDVALAADPFVNRAGGDYSLTDAAQLLLAEGTPTEWLGLSTTPASQRMIGAWQPSGSGSTPTPSRPVLSSPFLIGSLR